MRNLRPDWWKPNKNSKWHRRTWHTFSKLGPSDDFDQLVAEQEVIQTAHEEMSASHVDDIENYYRSVDAMLASTRSELPEDTLLMVMSDHGFQPYTRKSTSMIGWLKRATSF